MCLNPRVDVMLGTTKEPESLLSNHSSLTKILETGRKKLKERWVLVESIISL